MENRILVDGKLFNLSGGRDGIIADASQILNGDKSVAQEVSNIKEEIADLQNNTALETSILTTGDLDRLSERGLYQIQTASHTPDGNTTGHLTVVQSDENYIKQVWEAAGTYAYRYGTLEEVYDLEEELYIDDVLTDPINGEIHIDGGGTHVIRGYLKNAHITVGETTEYYFNDGGIKTPSNAPEASTKLILDGVVIESDREEAILYAPDYKTLTIHLEEGSLNFLISQSSEDKIESDPSAALSSWKNLTISGLGLLYIRNSYGGHGIKTKDDLVVKGYPYIYIDNLCKDDVNGHDAIHSSKSLYIENGAFKLRHCNDCFGIGSSNSGKAFIWGGTFDCLDYDGDVIDAKDMPTNLVLFETSYVTYTNFDRTKVKKVTFVNNETAASYYGAGTVLVNNTPLAQTNGIYYVTSIGADIKVSGFINGQISVVGTRCTIELDNAYLMNTVVNGPTIKYNGSGSNITVKSSDAEIYDNSDSLNNCNIITANNNNEAIYSSNNTKISGKGVLICEKTVNSTKKLAIYGDGSKYFRTISAGKAYIGEDDDTKDAETPETRSTSKQSLYIESLTTVPANAGKEPRSSFYDNQEGTVLVKTLNIPLEEGEQWKVYDVEQCDAYINYTESEFVDTYGDASGHVVSGSWVVLSETPELDLSPYATKEDLANIKAIKTYNDIDDAKEDLVNLDAGLIISVNTGASEELSVDGNALLNNYTPYMVIIESNGKKGLKEISSGSSQYESGTLDLTITRVVVGSETYTNVTEAIEAPLRSTITVYYTFISSNYPDVRGKVSLKKGGTVLQSASVYPKDGIEYSLTYTFTNQAAGEYTLTLLGVESTNKQVRTNLKLRLGTLTVENDTLRNNIVYSAGTPITFRTTVISGNPNAEITQYILLDNNVVDEKRVNVGNVQNTIPAIYNTKGRHILKIYLHDAISNKRSNEIEVSIICAVEGELFASAGRDMYRGNAGARITLALTIIELNKTSARFPTTLTILDNSGDPVMFNNKLSMDYILSYGENTLQLIGLPASETAYTATFNITSETDGVEPIIYEVPIKIDENQYNIDPITDGLVCWFDAQGKTNNSADRDSWTDKSPDADTNNIKQRHTSVVNGETVISPYITFNNFAWGNINGWLEDEDGNTALNLNSGAYVEVDLAPFEQEVTDAMTISIDFSTEDILDSNAKVVSCLYETDGQDEEVFYLRDAFGDYIKRDNENITNYFKYAGGYCWIDGQDYETGTIGRLANGDLPYEVTYSASERTQNYNAGEVNPYGPLVDEESTDYRKYTGTQYNAVTKQRGFYIDTQYAVLTNSASMADPEKKFHLNFSSNTRTKIDLIILRNPNNNTYYFPAMIGYINGVLSLFKTIDPDTTNDKFIHESNNGTKYKIYFGCKAKPDETGRRLTISDTGSSKLYSFKIYNRALTPDEILRNYAAEIPDNATVVTEDGRTVSKKEYVIDNNGILSSDTMAKLPELCLIGANMSNGSTPDYSINYFIMQLSDVEGAHVDDLKAVRLPAYLRYTDPTNDDNSWYNLDSDGHRTDSLIPIRLQFQGTSSMVYSSKNFKFRLCTKEGFDPVRRTYGSKVTRDIGNGIPESKFVIKVDFIDSSHCMNTQNANFIADYNELTGPTPSMRLNNKVRTTVYGKPVLLFYQEHDGEDVPRHFLGIANLNTDKSDNDTLGLKKKQPDNEGVEHNFGQPIYIDDARSQDILVKSNETISLYDEDDAIQKDYIAMKDPATGETVAALSEKGYLRTVNNDKLTNVISAEIKANSGSTGAAGFGNYTLDAVELDFEMRYPDEGDIESDEEGEYQLYLAQARSNDETPISVKQFKQPYLYPLRRLIKWVKNSTDEEFRRDFDLHFNRNYLIDYYLTFLFLGAVDSLGKNLMIQSHGPENHLYLCSEDYSVNEDPQAFQYTRTDGTTIWVTPNVNKSTTKNNEPVYEYATDSDGKLLFYDENCYSRVTNTFKTGYSSFVVTKIPGEHIWYPTYYDIDTASGLDNSGQLLYDVDIEMGDQLSDGTTVYNTDDSHLWSKVNRTLRDLASERWSILRQSKFTVENLVQKFYYGRSISKIPEKYYNDDALIKYIWEGPFKPGEVIGSSNVVATRGSGTYLYCIHGSRYEQMKRWFSQRLYYLDSFFGKVGTDNASLRFNYQKADPNFNGDVDNYYENYALLAEENPDQYTFDAQTNTLKATATGAVIEPITFNFKTYQPGYVGVKWYNQDRNHMVRVGRGKTAQIIGNVKTTGDAEVFIYGGENIKEIGNMAPYNVKQVDFRNLKKLNKLILGDNEHYPNISKLDLGVNSYLTELSLTNCTSLNTVNVASCRNLKILRMEGSGISGVTLPEGGALEYISYSSAISSIKLNNFVSLSTVTVPSNLANLTTLIINNCPKILGTKNSPTAKAWSILQMTRNVSALSDIQLESYGAVEPTILVDGSEWFFLDKYFDKTTSSKIKGEIYYKGQSIPTNYTKFATSYPDLKVTYDYISDASEMFANYNNINLIGTLQIYAGDDDFGNPKYKDVKYWVDKDPDVRDKWHTDTNIARYGKTTDAEYNASALFYEEGQTTYRLLELYDEEDLDMLRAEIKEHLSNFSKFTNVTGMFRNDSIIDYLDPDTFNNIDLSEADTTAMFYGCTNLEYFEVPGDIVKNIPETVYYDENQEIVTDISGLTPEVLEALDSAVKYRSPFNPNVLLDNPTSIYPKGMRTLGSNMFYNCKKLRCYIKKLPVETATKITIAEDAFEYTFYDVTKETQSNKVTFERPVVFFEHTAEDLLKTTNSSQTIYEGEGEEGNDLVFDNPAASNNKYFTISRLGERELSLTNTYINFTSAAWLREVYFNISEMVFDEEDNVKHPGFLISYAKTADNKKILTKVTQTTAQNNYFNYLQGDSNYFQNPLKIISYCQSSLMGLKNVITIELPLQAFDCLDPARGRLPEEYSIAGAFTDKIFTFDKAGQMQTCTIDNFLIVNSEIVYDSALRGLKFKRVGIGPSVKKVGSEAFKDMKIQNVVWFNFDEINNTTGTLVTRNEDVSFTAGTAGPNTIQLVSIGDYAFENCENLTSITLPKTVSSLGDGVFSGCSSLREARYSVNLTKIPAYTFYNCSKLVLASAAQLSSNPFSSGITEIGEFAFANCESLDIFRDDGGLVFEPSDSTLNFGFFSGLISIGNSAFQDTAGLIPSTDTFVGDTPRDEVSYKLYIPDTLLYIGDSAFYKEAKANEVNENGVIELVWDLDPNADYSSLFIGTKAFYNIRFAWSPTGDKEDLLKDVIFVPEIADIGNNAFYASSDDAQFKLVLTSNSEEEINVNFVNLYKKMIFRYKGILFDFTAEDSNAGFLKGQFILAQRLDEHDNVENVAYLQKSTGYITGSGMTNSSICIPEYITVDDVNYKFIEILSGAFDNYPSISTLWFGYNCALEHIETQVLTEDNAASLYAIFSTIGQSAATAEPVINKIPDNLIIDTGNNLSAWVSSQGDPGFIVLGRYIFGFNAEGAESITLDFNDPAVANCDIIYDDAFKDQPVTNIIFTDRIKYIYKSAFEGTHLDFSNSRLPLPGNIVRIETHAFTGIPIKELYFPRSLEYIGKDAFNESPTTVVKGHLRYVEFEDGCECTGFPFAVQKEIVTGNSTVSDANVTLQTIRVPSSMSWILSSKFDQLQYMSQLKNIYAGNLAVNPNDGTFLVDNVPLYLREDTGSITTDNTGIPYLNNDHQQLYCYKFLYDMFVAVNQYNNFANITTTEPKSICPIGDTSEADGIVLNKLDLTTVRSYDNYTVAASVGGDNAISDIQINESMELYQALMLAAGCSKRGGESIIYVDSSLNTRLSQYIIPIRERANVVFQPKPLSR